MSSNTEARLAKEYTAVLRGLDISLSELGEPHEGGGVPTPKQVANDLRSSSVSSLNELYDCLREVLANSARGIESPRHYWSHAPPMQLSEVLGPLGYSVEFERSESATGSGEQFDIVLEGDENTGTRRTSFTYPDSDFGTDNYPALLHAVETRILPEPNLEFVRLAERPEEQCWRFLLVDRRQIDRLREQFGERIQVFDRPLLATRQPADFAFEQPSLDLNDKGQDEDVPVQSVDAMDDAFRSLEQEAATEPAYGRRERDSASEEDDLVYELLKQ